jgi:hypothetical protein
VSGVHGRGEVGNHKEALTRGRDGMGAAGYPPVTEARADDSGFHGQWRSGAPPVTEVVEGVQFGVTVLVAASVLLVGRGV